MKRRSPRFSILFGWILWVTSLTYCQSPPDTSRTGNGLEKYIRMALQNNPELSAMKSRWESSRARIGQARAWDPPDVGIEFFQTPIKKLNPIIDGMETDYFIQQMIPFPGKIGLMTDMADNETRMAEQEYETKKFQLITQVKQTYFEIFLAQKRIEINGENQDLIRQFTSIANEMYATGMGKQEDVRKANLELSRLIVQQQVLKQDCETMAAMLNTLLNLPPQTLVDTIAEPNPDLFQERTEDFEILAQEKRPEVKAMQYNVLMNRTQNRISRREYFPDLMTRFMYKKMAEGPTDYWDVMLTMKFPFAPWSVGKFTKKSEETEMKVRESESNLQSMKNMVRFEVERAILDVRAKQKVVTIYRTSILPQSQQTLESSRTNYQTGKTDFLMLLDSYRMLLMAREEFYMNLTELYKAYSQLERAVGVEKF